MKNKARYIRMMNLRFVHDMDKRIMDLEKQMGIMLARRNALVISRRKLAKKLNVELTPCASGDLEGGDMKAKIGNIELDGTPEEISEIAVKIALINQRRPSEEMEQIKPKKRGGWKHSWYTRKKMSKKAKLVWARYTPAQRRRRVDLLLGNRQ